MADFRADRRFNRVAQGVVAQIVVPVADHHDHAAHFRIRPLRQRGIRQNFRSPVDRIVQRRPAAGALIVNRVGEQRRDRP